MYIYTWCRPICSNKGFLFIFHLNVKLFQFPLFKEILPLHLVLLIYEPSGGFLCVASISQPSVLLCGVDPFISSVRPNCHSTWFDRIRPLILHPVGKVIWIIPLFSLYIFKSDYWLLDIVGRILIGIILDMWHIRGELISIWLWVHENKYPSPVIGTILNATHLCFIVFSTQILLKLLTLFKYFMCFVA